jgi:hypothetical protein
MDTRFNRGTEIGFVCLLLALIGAGAGFDQDNQARKSLASFEELRARADGATTDIDRNARGQLINALKGAAERQEARASFCFKFSGVCLGVGLFMLAVFAAKRFAEFLNKSQACQAVE